MSTIAISAGRNIGDTPMTSKQWTQLRSDIKQTLKDSGADVYTWDALGFGEWTADSGEVIREESVTYVGSLEDSKLPSLEDNLARIAREYMQDAIALMVGNSLLVRG